MAVLLSDDDIQQSLRSIYLDTRKWELTRVVVGQREEADLKENGWHDIFCCEVEGHSEAYQGTLENFVSMLMDLGWHVVNVEHYQAICPACQNAQDESHYASQYEDNRGLLG